MREFKNYELVEQRMIDDVHAMSYILRHKKSGARVVILSNDDDNKVFCIGFRTPPKEDTGVPHILEHSVLCGSTHFPVKDPFIELAKGSLNTYLNASTYPDKTIYPIASYNDKDFRNLMHIYMDAVFFPNILKSKAAFLQEAWHYELEDREAPLEINGVVYNEMRGAYSSSDEILASAIMRTLLPDTPYAYDYGGAPDAIPQLTYEHYLEFYKKYYHPSNSYIYLYGDMDIEERLEWMDKEYLSLFDAIDVDSKIEHQKAFDKVAEVEVYAPITEEEKEEESGILSYNLVIDDITNTELYYAFDILEYALGSVPGAPVRQALLDAGIGQDVYSSFNCEIKQTYFEFTAKNANVADKDRFVSTIQETLQKVVKDGLDKKALLAGINSSEFRFREADFGSIPKGLIYAEIVLNSWLYDESKPFSHLECLKTFQFLREQVETDYFEKLIERYLLKNTHGAVISVVPQKGLLEKQEKELEDKLAEYKASLNEEELQHIFDDMELLASFQDTEDSKEALATIPVLDRKDLRKVSLPYSNTECMAKDVKVVCHDYETNGIDYLTLMFDINDISFEELPYLGLLRGALGGISTEEYSYRDLVNEINIVTGGVNGSIVAYPLLKEVNKVDARFEMRVRCLSSQSDAALHLLEQIVLHSDYNDEKRVREIIAQAKARLSDMLSGAGHVTAYARGLSGISLMTYYKEATSGIAYYRFICEMDELMKTNPKEVLQKMKALANRIFTSERLNISYTGAEQEFERIQASLTTLVKKLPKGEGIGTKESFEIRKTKEAFTDSSQIQYVARVGNFLQKGYEYHGALRVLRIILGYDYLWMNVRMKGGAYGCMNSFSRTGDAYFVSYRDPNLVKTDEIYQGIPEYLKNFRADEATMNKYVVGTFGVLDTPLSPDAKGNRSMAAYMEDLTLEDIQKERDQILNVTETDINNLSDLVKSVLDDNILCVVGNENVIKDNASIFDCVSGLCE